MRKGAVCSFRLARARYVIEESRSVASRLGSWNRLGHCDPITPRKGSRHPARELGRPGAASLQLGCTPC
jgi:hypothetical protein